jgi:DNA-binding transcriptional MerR regulator
MEITINKLASLAGISTRTLRYYDEIGLLKPKRIKDNGYRIYGQTEIDRLQQIMFYRALEVSLDDIAKIIYDVDFDESAALDGHLISLLARKAQLEMLISNVEKTIASNKGEIDMSNAEKFEGFKAQLVDENEKKYGSEVRAKYGDSVVDASNKKIKGMSKEQYERGEELRAAINEALILGVETADVSGDVASELVELHKEWLCIFAPKGLYSKEYHLALGEMYVADERFKKYYDDVVVGGAEFLNEALKKHLK